MPGDLSADPDRELYEDIRSPNGRRAVDELLPRIKEYACRRFSVDGPAADEIAVEAFDRVCMQVIAGRFAGQSKFFTWVSGISNKVYLEWKRKQIKDGCLVGEEFAAELVSSDPQPDAVLIDKETREFMVLLLDEAVDGLPPVQRAVYCCKYRRDPELSNTEIAAELGKSEGAVRSAIVDAYANIRRSMRANGYERDRGAISG